MIQINRLRIHPPPAPQINLRADIDQEDHNDRYVHREESLGRRRLAQRPHGEVELGDEQDDAPSEPPPGAPGPGPGRPGEFLGVAALHAPGAPHADVRQADHAPAEKGEEGGEGGEPAEDFGARVVHVDVGEGAADEERGDERVPGAAHGVGFLHELQ